MTFILNAYKFDGKGSGQVLNEAEVSQAIEDEHFAWAHFDANDPHTPPFLEREISYLDPYITQALLAEETRPRVVEIDSGLLIILRGVNVEENADPDDMVSVRLWVDKFRVISVQRRRVKATQEIDALIKAGKGPTDAADFICLLISKLFDRLDVALIALDESTDEIEDKILDRPDFNLREDISYIRRQSIMFKRHMAPQRDVLAHLKMLDLKWLKPIHKRSLHEDHDRVLRYIEDLDAIKERAQIVRDELTNTLTHTLNNNMYLLSVIAAIFLPLGFLTGLFGMNVNGIPFSNSNSAFWIVGGILLLVVAFQMYLFKIKKWF